MVQTHHMPELVSSGMREARSFARLTVGRVVADSKVGLLGQSYHDHISQRLASECTVDVGRPDVFLQRNTERVISFESKEKCWNTNCRGCPGYIDEIRNVSQTISCEPVVDQVAIHDRPAG